MIVWFMICRNESEDGMIVSSGVKRIMNLRSILKGEGPTKSEDDSNHKGSNTNVLMGLNLVNQSKDASPLQHLKGDSLMQGN